jgi:Anti-sigma factor NepR
VLELKGEMKDMTKDITAGAADGRRAASGDPLGPNSEIGRKLKQYYDELVSDHVPDRFSQLLSQLEQAEPAQKKD